MYDPEPVDTSNIDLPKKLDQLIEQLSEHVHDVWALQRISEGWVWGPKRNDDLKHHPDIVPYEQLAENDKEYDRNTATETIKVLMSMGVSFNWESIHVPPPMPGKKEMPQPLPNRAQDIYELWCGIQSDLECYDPDQIAGIVKELTKKGEPLLAYEVVIQARDLWENNLLLIQLHAHALNRLGAYSEVITLLAPVIEQEGEDAESNGILARAHKDLADQLNDNEQQNQHLSKAMENYINGYTHSKTIDDLYGQIYTGINAATIAMKLGHYAESNRLAQEVEQVCGIVMDKKKESVDYWTVASLGESALLMKNLKLAEKYYRQAADMARAYPADLASMARQAKMICRCLQFDETLISQWMESNSIAIFAGRDDRLFHMESIDEVNRLKMQYIQRMHTWFKDENVLMGYAGALPGVDLIFHQALQKNQLKSHVILPCPVDEFKLLCKVESNELISQYWESILDEVLSGADTVQVVSNDSSLKGHVQFDYLLGMTMGMATLKARELEAKIRCLGVWPTEKIMAYENLRQVIVAWQSQTFTSYHYDPLTRAMTQMSQDLELGRVSAKDEDDKCIVALLFSDVKGFSKLKEEQVFRFQELYWNIASDVIEKTGIKPNMMNTWGDALYSVFENIPNAGEFSVAWQHELNQVNWSDHGLPDFLKTRIALHAGPTRLFTDPVIGKQSYIGTHVSHTARLEPVTPPGQIYSTLEFAALSTIHRANKYHMEYAGQAMLAKDAGVCHAYRVVAN